MPERTLVVRIIGDDTSLQRAFARSTTGAKEMQVGVSGVGSSIAKSFIGITAGIFTVEKGVEVLRSSVDEASAMNKEVSRSEAVFGESARAIESWAGTAATAFGVSRLEALKTADSFGLLFRQVDIAPDKIDKMSTSLVGLASDVASFNNADPSDVLKAFQRGLVGMYRPLRQYSILLDSASVNAEALKETGKKNATELTAAEKVTARYNLILRQTSIFAGNFRGQQDKLANQTKILKANMANLEEELGKGIIPALFDLSRLANLAFIGLSKLGSVHVPGGTDVKNLFGWVSGWKELHFLLNQVEGDAKDTASVFDLLAASVAKSVAGLSTAIENAAKRTVRAQAAQAKASQRRFGAHVKGLGLKLDKAEITADTNDDLRVLNEIERSILKRERAVGKTFDLETQLTDVRARRAAILETRATDAAQASSDAFNNALDALNLKLSVAETTRGFNDDMRALKEIERTILGRIKVEGRTTELMSLLFENRQAQAAKLKEATQARQFLALGLTATGEERLATRKTLLRRARSLQESIKGTILDTPKTRAELRRITKVLSGSFGALGRDVRASIVSMLDDISSGLEKDEGGALTKFAKRGVEPLIRGLGLTAAQTKEIRQRFSQFGRFDVGAPGARAPRGPAPGTVQPQTGEVVVNVYVDGQKVESSVTRRQQKKRGRNASQRRGVNPGARR